MLVASTHSGTDAVCDVLFSAGSRHARVEDERFLAGRGQFVGDLPPIESAVGHFVRSSMAHAKIIGIDTSMASSLAGVLGVWTARELNLPDQPGPTSARAMSEPVLASDVVRYVGEAVVLIVADSAAVAADAAALVRVDYAPLKPVFEPEAAANNSSESPLFVEVGTNLASEVVHAVPDALAEADIVIRGRFVNQRVVPVPLEGNSVLAVPDGDLLTVWLSTRRPFTMRKVIAATLGMLEEDVRVVAPDVGGAFGTKSRCPPGGLAIAHAARVLKRPVRWIESRSESMVAMNHGRGHVQYVELGAKRDGTLTGIRIHVIADCGAYPSSAGLKMPTRSYLMGCGVYRIPRVDFRSQVVVTNRTPIGPYRGAGRPEATALIERSMDLLANALQVCPVELRRRNLIARDEFPYTTSTGATYDSGDYEAALDMVVEAAEYGELRKEQARRRQAGVSRLLGIGVSAYVEVTASNFEEYAEVSVGTDGRVSVYTGVSPHGQGHETSFAQIIASLLSVPVAAVAVRHSDTGQVRRGSGTGGSRSLQIGGSAVFRAGTKLVCEAKRVAAVHWAVAEADIDVVANGLKLRGAREAPLTWGELATLATSRAGRPDATGLRASDVFDQGGSTYPSGAHLVVVEVDSDTGYVSLLRYIAADDCGRVFNPMLVDGQMHGGIAQGVAQALYEAMVYDRCGVPMTDSLETYNVPTAPDLPHIELFRPETPSPLNPLQAKGAGESGAVGSPPAVQNAVVDALAHLGVRHIDMPLTPLRVWRSLKTAERARQAEGARSSRT